MIIIIGMLESYNINDVVMPTVFVREQQSKEYVLDEFNKKCISSPNVYHEDIVAAFGGSEAMQKIGTCDVGDRMGSTGYMDFLLPNDLNSSIVKGTDCFTRPFVSVRVRNKAENGKYVFTIFKRYTTPSSTQWSVGARKTIIFEDNDFIFSGDTIHSNDCNVLKFVKRLLENSDPEYELN
jgi:hypothetical protein